MDTRWRYKVHLLSNWTIQLISRKAHHKICFHKKFRHVACLSYLYVKRYADNLTLLDEHSCFFSDVNWLCVIDGSWLAVAAVFFCLSLSCEKVFSLSILLCFSRSSFCDCVNRCHGHLKEKNLRMSKQVFAAFL